MTGRFGVAALCLVVALAVAVVAAIGVFGRGDLTTEPVVSPRGEAYELVTDGVYAYNPERLVAEGVGWDVFTLFVAVPWMLVTIPAVRRGSLRGRLIALGLMAYFFYQYFMYAMAWAFGPLFVPFVIIYAASLVGIVWLASGTDISHVAARFSQRFPRRGMAIFSAVMALLLVGMWSGRIATAMSGDLEGAMLLGQTTFVVQALDLGLVVPLAVCAAVLLWRERPLGYLIGPVLVVKAVAMCGAITTMLIGAWLVEGSPDVGGLAIFATAAAASLWLGARMYRAVLPSQASSLAG